jgi:hypothetical protein
MTIVTQPPKPLLDRLPAIPSRASSKIIPNVGREEAAHKRLKARLQPIATAELQPPGVDPRTAAVSALMVANFVADPGVRKRFAKFIEAELIDTNALDDLPVAARLVLRILQKLEPDLEERTTDVPSELLAAARSLRDRLIRVAERFFADIDEANGQLTTIRLGDGAADTVYDLRMLAGLCRAHAETLATEAGTTYSLDLERDARATAQRLEDALVGPQTGDEREWRAYLLRALVMLVPLYEEVCRAGRFLFHDEKPETHFPTLASVARVRRRVKRESARRTVPVPGMPSVKPGIPSVNPLPAPLRVSIPPEVSLVDVSPEREQVLAVAIEAAVPPPPRPAKLEALEAVTLDFAPAPPVAPTAGEDGEQPDLELDLTFRSESNFYTDVSGTILGLFIATWVVVPVGTTLVVRLTVPHHDRPFIVSGLVHWVLEFSPSIEAPPGIGLALRPLQAGEPRRAIEAFMKARAPILHDE